MLLVLVLVVVLLAVLLVTLLVLLFATPVGDTLIAGWQKLQHQRRTYHAAYLRARATGKELLVIGDPRAPGTLNSTLPGYGCGDVCLDLKGCACPNSIAADALQALRRMANNSAVIYESETLEFVPDIAPVVREMKRVSGGDLFATHFVGVRTRLLGDKKKRWTPRRIIVQFPPHSDYVWHEGSSQADWQKQA